MAPITEFPFFRHLPPEIRIKIWKLVPQPARVIGLLPPVSTWYRKYHYSEPPGDNSQEPSTDGHSYHYRYIVQPRRQAIFPPLHVNREARVLWLPRFFQPPRRFQVSGLYIQFDTPFISYNTDIFTVFDGWPLNGLENGIAYGDDDVIDCFIGLERSRIRNVSVCQSPSSIRRMAGTIAINTLPNLEMFTILALGPCIFSQYEPTIDQHGDGSIARTEDGSKARAEAEMPVVDAQRTSCEIYDLPTDIVQKHYFFTRIRVLQHMSLTDPIYRYQTIVRSWLWHEMQIKNLDRTADQMEESWWEYMDYLFDDEEDGTCPMMLDGCGNQGHTRREMLEWELPFLMDFKLLYADVWQEKLKISGIIS